MSNQASQQRHMQIEDLIGEYMRIGEQGYGPAPWAKMIRLLLEESVVQEQRLAMLEQGQQVLANAAERLTVILQYVSWEALNAHQRTKAGELNMALCEAFPWLKEEPVND